jgi:hypothetical protein
MEPQKLQELKRALLCLVSHGESIANQLWKVTERYALHGFFENKTVHVPSTQEEDEPLLADYLVVGLMWVIRARTCKMRSSVQLKTGGSML